MLPVTVQLPAIAAERASRGLCSPSSGVVHHSNPFVSDPAEVAANVFGEPSSKDPTASANFQVEALLRLQLAADPQVEVCMPMQSVRCARSVCYGRC